MSPPPVARESLATALDRRAARRWALMTAGIVLLAVVAVASTALGATAMGPGHVLRALASPLLPTAWTADIPQIDKDILLRLRLPRTMMAMAAGGGLALAGVGLQGVTRNPLVSPYTLGISSAAAFGASIAMLLGAGVSQGAGEAAVAASAFVMALACAALVLGVATLNGVTPIMLILGGVALNFLFDALTANVQFLASDTQLAAVVHWTFGSLNGARWSQALGALGALAVTFGFLRSQAWALNAFSAGGDEVTASLGFAVGRTRALITLACVLVTAVIVSFTGKIGFVGLVAPHVARMLIGADHRTLTPFAVVVGAILLLCADLVGRVAFAPVVVPVGIVVAYLGVPIFVHLLITRRRDLA